MKWFKHDTDANQDAKLQNVLLDYGLEGYGLYWYCLELIAGKVELGSLTFQLEHDVRIVARNTGSTPARVEEILRYFIKLGLFEEREGAITCMKLARRLDQSMTSSPAMRTVIGELRARGHDGVMTSSCLSHDGVMQDKKKKEENTSSDLPPAKQEATLFSNDKAKVNPKGTRLPEGFAVPDDWIHWAVHEAKHLTKSDIAREALTFADFWIAKPGKEAFKLDWQATWRNWIRRADKEPGRNPQHRHHATDTPIKMFEGYN
ncbi:DUF4373 domain-containing protein [Aeromonas caviae]|uniref:Lin1244/Lin1753 domain-containing protein n=1 Tax=Aeromonas caviae TaxID=648 RepID=UPI002AB356E3|nr:Lin1244/Lin1753 domain-containing protein [Aeromonas caviae]MDY7839698.1 DUF4373 domain-containing protein [Aeromonas caviae]